MYYAYDLLEELPPIGPPPLLAFVPQGTIRIGRGPMKMLVTPTPNPPVQVVVAPAITGSTLPMMGVG